MYINVLSKDIGGRPDDYDDDIEVIWFQLIYICMYISLSG